MKKQYKIMLTWMLCISVLVGAQGVSTRTQKVKANEEGQVQNAVRTPLPNEKEMSDIMQRSMLKIKGQAGDRDNFEVKEEWATYLKKEWSDLVGTYTAGDGTSYFDFDWAPTEFTAALEPWDGTITAVNETNKVIEVKTAGEFRGALDKIKGGSNGYTIRVLNDLDFNGAQQKWTPISAAGNAGFTGVTIEGGGHSFYNIATIDTAFITTMTASTVKDLTFSYTNIVNEGMQRGTSLGVFGRFTMNQTTRVKGVLENVAVNDSLIYYGRSYINYSDRGYMSPFGYNIGIVATNASASRNQLFAASAIHVGGAFVHVNSSEITQCFSVDSTVISVGQHSGGFISCTDIFDMNMPKQMTVKQCFTNNKVYGNKETGVFIGAVRLQNQQGEAVSALFEECYASGSVEGTSTLGGFVGELPIMGYQASVEFKECYSTSIVGMQKGGEYLGGFVGRIYKPEGFEDRTPLITFTDSYAAGEVGGIDTDASSARTAFKTVGGFLGSDDIVNSPIVYNNVFYDKQTTAMKEWETGGTLDAAPNLTPGLSGQEKIDLSQEGINDIAGIKGALTSDSQKGGAGLASIPNVALETGFSGFTTDTYDAARSPESLRNNIWVYDGREDLEENPKHNCMYPQLKSLSKADPAIWKGNAELVQATSMASVSTFHENTWERCINNKHLSLHTSTYDTVRDLTSAFTMTSYADLAPNASISWTKTNATTKLYGKTVPVVSELNPVMNATWNRKYYRADQFAPGIEWFTVTYNVNGVEGKRRLRVIPTTNMTAGDDQLGVNVGETYNHGADMLMAYSTGTRMAPSQTVDAEGTSFFEDVTQGAYPSKDSAQKNVFQYNYFNDNGTYVSKVENKGIGNAAGYEDMYSDSAQNYLIPTNYMSGNNGTTHLPNNNYLLTNAFQLIDLDSLPINPDSGDVLIDMDDPEQVKSLSLVDAQDATKLTEIGKKLSGKTAFENKDVGRYLVEYVWALPDARYIKGSKLLVVQGSLHETSVEVQDVQGNSDDQSVKLDVGEYVRNTPLAPTFPTNPSASGKKDKIATGNASYIAVKKAVADDPTFISKIRLEYTLDNGSVQFVEVDNPIDAANNSVLIELPFSYYYYTYELNGKYSVKKSNITKKYELKYDAAQDFFYLSVAGETMLLDNNGNQLTDFDGNAMKHMDMGFDLRVTLTLDEPLPAMGTLEITKVLFDVNGNPYAVLPDALKEDSFVVSMQGMGGLKNMSTSVLLKPTLTKTLKLSPGEYTLKEIVPMNYEFIQFMSTLPGESAFNPAKDTNTITIEADKTTQVHVENKTTITGGGKGGVSNVLTR